MTNQEAIEYFKNKLDLTLNLQKGQTDRNALAISSQNIEAYELAIDALEKQEPMRVAEIDEEYGYYVCPSCGEKITAIGDFEDHEHCLNCGQHVRWENTDDEH